MDLTEISRRRVRVDTEIAMARILDLSIEIDAAAIELKALREELAALNKVKAASTATTSRDANGAPAHEAHQRSKPKFSVVRLLGKRAPAPEIRWHLDDVGGKFPQRSKEGVNVTVSRSGGSLLTISGWIVPLDGRPAFAIAKVVLSGPNGAVTRSGETYVRDDVAAHFGQAEFASCGFRFDIPMAELSDGRHALEIIGYSSTQGEIAALAGFVELR